FFFQAEDVIRDDLVTGVQTCALPISPGHAVADYRTALDAVDAVDVVTSAESHWDVARASLAAGRHCFVEKPLARTLAEARLLDEIGRASCRERGSRSVVDAV